MKKMEIYSTWGQRIIFIEVKEHKVVSNVEMIIEDKVVRFQRWI